MAKKVARDKGDRETKVKVKERSLRFIVDLGATRHSTYN
jgi:hypothetical protein